MPLTDGAYALQNLLPAGSVQLYVNPEDARCVSIPVGESKDWVTLGPFLEAHGLSIIDASLPRFKELEFLVGHRFLRAMWRTLIRGRLLLHVRVYLIPFDLPGVHGSLAARNRDESKVLLPARKALTSLLSNTDRSAMAWAGCASLGDTFEPFFPEQTDTRSLSEIYGDLPSPSIDPSRFLSGIDPRTQRSLRLALHREAPPGMRSSLYVYQRRTLVRMLQQELDPGTAPDPLYIPIHGVQGSDKTFYMQPSNMEILSEVPLCSQAKGGILCEEMGTGKTCIVLGLIMATKYQLSSPEEAPPECDVPERLVLTPLSFRHFPSPQFVRAREVARFEAQPTLFPSLVEILTHYIRTSFEFISSFDHDISQELEERYSHLWQPLVRNQPFYYVFEQISQTGSPRRKGYNRGPRKVYLTSATLVIVPRAIMGQWNSEINKHCEDGSLKVLYLGSETMPPAQKLASEYDIVLMTHERFAAEKSRCDLLDLHSWTQCQCEGVVTEKSRVPFCECSIPDDVSPLVQIRWKRLVVDEGHVSATRSNLAKLSQDLNVERRWIVSGTPTRNMMGLSLGQSEQDIDEPLDGDEEEDGPSMFVDEGPTCGGELLYPCEDTDEGGEGPVPRDHEPTDRMKQLLVEPRNDGDHTRSHIRGRRWTRVDRDDLAKLGEMVSRFIGVPRFALESDLFRRKVATPLLDPHGPYFGAIQVVSQVMQLTMFRHQIRDVERELPEKLPTLKEKTVALKFQLLAAKTYNVLQAGIAVNAVDSERKDQDYLFHPRSRAALGQTLQNLTQTMFWRTDEDVFDINEALKRSEDALAVALERNVSQSDVRLVEQSIRVQRDALLDELWYKVMLHEDLPFAVRGFTPTLQAAWFKLDASLFENQAPLLDPGRLCKLRELLRKTPSASESRLVEQGLDVAAEEERLKANYKESQKVKRKKRTEDDVTKSFKVKQANAKTGSKETEEELSRELIAAIDRRERGTTETTGSLYIKSSRTIGDVPSISVGKSGSSKINYILKKLLKHAAEHKFLIFSAFPLSLAYIAEALDIAHIPYLPYTSGVKPNRRQQIVVTFETSDKYRVLLMELKLGARGLNLVSASRIIFCEPVWQGDVESQAIKRAYRIGQKCSQLKVTTLIMQGTSEEAMVTRRDVLRRKAQRLPAMVEDQGMSKFLQNPTFIGPENIESVDSSNLDIPLLPGYTTRTECPVENPTQTGDMGEMEVDVTAPRPRVTFAATPELPAKRRKMVHFD